MKPAVAEVVPYPGSSLPQRLRIRILSRVAKPEEAARMYGALIEQEGLPVFGSSPGSFHWEVDNAHLVVSVGPREDIEPSRLATFDEYPQVYRFSFPLSSVVEALLRGLLGRGQKKNQMFAAVLGDHGRSTTMQPETSIPACILWRLLRAVRRDAILKPPLS